MMKLPDGVFKQELLQYLTLNDLIMLDSACANNEFRPQLLEKLSGVIFIGDGKDDYMDASLFKWLGLSRIYLIKIFLSFEEDNSFLSSVKNDYVGQFRYTQHVNIRGPLIDDISTFIISHCPCLVSVVR